MYYEMIQAAMLADLHSFKLLMTVHVPLKTMNVQFTLYRVAVLPVRLSNHSFVQFEVEKDYFGIDVLQRHYLPSLSTRRREPLQLMQSIDPNSCSNPADRCTQNATCRTELSCRWPAVAMNSK
jgi:hypothetical protein